MRDLRRLLRYLLPHTGTFVIATFAMIVVAVLETSVAKLRLFRVPELLAGSFMMALLAVVSFFFLR